MLCRIDLLAAKGEDDFQAACDMEDWLSEHGVLVPMEPDYEAGWSLIPKWIRQVIDEWRGKGATQELVHLIVDAALKEGN